jgi:hypothetical protein
MENQGYKRSKVNGGYRWHHHPDAARPSMTINIDMLQHFGKEYSRKYEKASGNYSHQCREDGYYYDKLWFVNYETPTTLPEELFEI